MTESSNLDGTEALSTPANLRSTIYSNIFSDFLSPPPDDTCTSSDQQSQPYQRRSLVVRMDELLRQQRESAERLSAEEQRSHVAKIAGDVLVPDQLDRDRSSRITYLPLRPYRSPSHQMMCAICARESMKTPPQNGATSSRCICRTHNASIRSDPILEISVAMSTLGEDVVNDDDDDTNLVRRLNTQSRFRPRGLSLDIDVEDSKDLPKATRDDTTNCAKRPSPIPPGSPLFEVDNTELGADPALVHQPRPPRLVPRLANGACLKATSAPLFPPLMTPENSRSVIDLPSDGPLDVPFLTHTPHESSPRQLSD